jgi:hypothetical protein
MRSLAFNLVALLALGASACGTGAAGDTLRDNAAAAVLQEAWKSATVHAFLGPLQFRHDPLNQYSNAKDEPCYDYFRRYPVYQTLASKGLLTLSDERNLTGAFTGWQDFYALTQKGVQRTATIALTPEGTKTGSTSTSGAKKCPLVSFETGTYRIEKIVSNQPLEINGDKYQIVMGTHTFEMKQEFADVLAASGETTDRDRRFRALIKYDPFDTKWKLQMADVGRRDLEFPSDIVPRVVAGLRQSAGAP